MARVVVVQFDSAASSTLLDRLARDGMEAEPATPRGTKCFRTLRAAPPDAILIDLTSMPFYGRWMAAHLRQSKTLRTIPLVFLEGEPAKTSVAKKQFPDATFSSWERLAPQIGKAIARQPREPVVPDIFAGPIPKKLRIQPSSRVALLNAPKDFELPTLPEGVRIQRRPGSAEVTLAFLRSAAALSRQLPTLSSCLEAGNTLWICWPKKAAGGDGDLSMPLIRALSKPHGLVDNKVVSLDSTWSAMALAKRRATARR